jgi:hypothetical protein
MEGSLRAEELLHGVCRHSEPNAIADHRIDTDYLTMRVCQRAAGIAPCEAHIGVYPPAAAQAGCWSKTSHNTYAEGSNKPQRAACGDRQFAGAYRVRCP